VAFDTEGAFVYVTDGLAGHIRRFPFTDFALR
jgi:sugar lactone lactonase YvrE